MKLIAESRSWSSISKDNTGIVISCAFKEEVDAIFENASNYGGAVTDKATIDEIYREYIGYISSPDGHLRELVYSPQQT